MQIQRAIPVILEQCDDLQQTVIAYTAAKNIASPICFNNGDKPLSQHALQTAVYEQIRNTGITAQLACSVCRSVGAAYVTKEKQLKKNERKRKKQKNPKPAPSKQAIQFNAQTGLFLIGDRGRDASFTKDGKLSISTINGRQKLTYRIPEPFQDSFTSAVSIDSLTVTTRYGKLTGKLTITLDVPEPHGKHPVGVDLNETNLIVAVDSEGREFIYNGIPLKARNKRTRQVRKRLQSKLGSLKAQGGDTRSVRRCLKRLGEKQSNRTRNECHIAAKRLTDWAGEDAILVLEDLHLEPVSSKDYRYKKSTRRRLNSFPYKKLRESIESRCEVLGARVELVNPAYTSQRCNRCGDLGERNRHKFSCECGYSAHSDVNAAKNIRDKFVVLRCDGVQSIIPEAQLSGQAVAL